MLDLDSVRYAVSVTRDDGGPDVVDVDVDELQDKHLPVFENWTRRRCEGTEQQIALIALAQAYAAPDGGLVLAGEAMRAISDLCRPYLVAAVEAGVEESVRDALYKVSSFMVDAPRYAHVGHTIARSRLWATCQANAFSTEGAEDPSRLRMESRR